MDAVRIDRPLSPAAYLRFEQEAGRREERYEYLDGYVYAMVGASRRHGTIVGNLYTSLRPVAQRAGCEVQSQTVKVRIEEANCYYYPDVVVTCAAGDTDPLVIHQPCLIVEVLSPSTEGTDRREKLVNYKKRASIQDILLVHSDRPVIEQHSREGDGWLVTLHQAEGTVSLRGLDAAIPVAEVFG